MARPVNLNKVRKARARAEKAEQAAQNAVRFGRSKAQKAAEASQSAKDRAALDGHKRDP